MKKLAWLLLPLPFLSSRCHPQATKNNCLQGKVIRITCASTVIQVLNTDTVGDMGWHDMMDSSSAIYDHVFTATNPCKLPAGLKANDVVYFTISKDTPGNCVVCLMYDAPPKSAFRVDNLSFVPCSKTGNGQ